MTVGMKTIARITNAQKRAETLGFTFVEDEYNANSKNDEIGLAAIGETLPAIRDGAVIFKGNLDEVESFLTGFYWARWYDIALGLKTDKRREVSEQKLRNKLLLRDLKESGQ